MPLDDTFTVTPLNQVNGAGDTWALITERFNGVVEGTIRRRSVIAPLVKMESVTGTDTIRMDAVGESTLQVVPRDGSTPDGTGTDFAKINLVVDTPILSRNTVPMIDEYQQNFDKLAAIAEEQGKRHAKFQDQMLSIQAAKAALLTDSAFGAGMSGHFGGYTKTLSAAGDATDPMKLYAAFLDVFAAMNVKDVDLQADGVIAMVKPAQFYALFQNELLINAEYITAFGNKVMGPVLKAMGVPVVMSNNYIGGTNVTAHEYSNARNSNAYNGDFTKHVAGIFSPKAILAGQTIPLQSKIWFSDERKLWFIDSWTATGARPARAEYAAAVLLP
jgi:hypothetical protein